MEKKYKITCNEEQIRMISFALEQYSRMICGQLGHNYMPSIETALHKEIYVKGGSTLESMQEMCRVRDIVDQHLEQIKTLIWNLGGASHGLHYDKDSDMSYEMYKAIKHQFEVEKQELCKKEGIHYSHNVHSAVPLKLTDVPNIKVEIVDPRLEKLERIVKDSKI